MKSGCKQVLDSLWKFNVLDVESTLKQVTTAVCSLAALLQPDPVATQGTALSLSQLCMEFPGALAVCP